MTTHEKFSRRSFLQITSLGTTAVLLGGCASLSESAPHAYHPLPCSVQLKIDNPRKLRILQLTDIHLGPESIWPNRTVNRQTEALMANLIAKARADLVIVTGDSWAGNREPGGEDNMREVVAKHAAWGVPWAFTWGNHDQLIDNAQGHKALTEAAHSLYRGADTGGNYVIDVVDRRDRRVCQLVCLNSLNDGLGKEQQDWMRKLAEDTAKAGDPQPLRYAFFHIPIKQYAEIWDNGVASGIKGETCCTGDEQGASLAVLKSLGVRACFCGHDHVNNYSGLSDGVDLVYGRATGLGSYGNDRVPKGGTLITINCARGKMDWTSLVHKQPNWKPRKGERIIIPPKK